MQQRQFGRNGPLTSCIGVGAMSFSDFYGPTDEAASHAILDAALELGVSHIDTANVYGMGRSDSAIGTFLKARPDAGDQFHIATKAAITRHPDGTRYFDNSAAHLEAELDNSLARIGIECADLFYIHRRDAAMPIEEATENLARLVKAGKTRAIGFSEIAPTSLRRAHAVHPIAAVQSEYSLATRSPELGLVQICVDLGTAMVAFSPVSRSLLTDNPLSAAAIQNLGFLAGNPRFNEPNLSANMRATDNFRTLAADMGTSAAALAIAWLLHQDNAVIPISGSRSVSHFRELVAGANLQLRRVILTVLTMHCRLTGRTGIAIQTINGLGQIAIAETETGKSGENRPQAMQRRPWHTRTPCLSNWISLYAAPSIRRKRHWYKT